MSSLPNYTPDISRIQWMLQTDGNAQRMHTALYEFIRAHVRHAQDLSWLDGHPRYQDLFHRALEQAIEKGHDAVRVLAAQDGIKMEKAAALFRQFVKDHPNAFAEFYSMLDNAEIAEVKLAGIDPDKYLDHNKEP